MPLKIDGYLVVKSNNRRECNFYINYLRTQNVIVTPIFSSHLDNNNSINDSIKNNIKDESIANRMIRDMVIDLRDSLINEERFEWVKYNDRACQWLWLKLKIMPTSEIENTYIPYRESSKFAYENFIQAEIAVNIKDKYKKIITFFDNWPANIEKKEIKLNEYSYLWSNTYKNLLSMDWLDENNIAQCKWAWQYLNKHGLNINYITPLSDLDMYGSVYASLDIWEVHIDTKKRFLIDFRKAWVQKNYRDNHAKDAKINYYISKSTKRKIDKLVKDKGMINSKLIEYLVEKEYKETYE